MRDELTLTRDYVKSEIERLSRGGAKLPEELIEA